MEKIWHKSYAQGIPRTIDYEKVCMPDQLALSARKYPDNDAIVFDTMHISYRSFDRLANRMANALIDHGVRPGDRVAILLPNIPQVAVAAYAVWRAGGVVVMNNPLYTDKELLHQFKDSGAVYLITLDLLAPRMLALIKDTNIKNVCVAHIRDHLPFIKKLLFPLIAKDKHRKIKIDENAYEWSDVLEMYPDISTGIQVKTGDVAALQYTGGTTGVSKGVVLTHENLSVNAQQGLAWLPHLERGKGIVLGSLPIFHAFGLFAMNMCIMAGWSLVMVPRPEAEPLLKAIHKNRVNLFPGVPTMFVGMLNHPDIEKYDLSSLQICVSGAAPCPVDVIRRFEEKTGAQVVEGFGMSEASPATHINPVGGVNKPGSIGLPLPDVDVKIVNGIDGDTEVPLGEPGELCIKGPQVSSAGYYNMPDETANTFRDGWLYSGDMARLDEDGYLYIVDRKKDMIIAGGYNIYPREIDEVLFAHPKIMEACAKGVPDPYRGETVKAFVVPARGETLTEEEVISYCRKELAAYKVPKMVAFMDELPKSAVGKILRKDL